MTTGSKCQVKRYDNSEKNHNLKNALAECLSLRAICRMIGLSLTWMQAFAQSQWIQTPKNLDLNLSRVKQVKKLQIFGIQANELWSFVHKKSEKDAKKFWKKIPRELQDCDFEMDHLSQTLTSGGEEAHQSILPEAQHQTGKDLTY